MILTGPLLELPTDNAQEIPALRLDRQGTITHPVVPWGSVSRQSTMEGTWTFYCDDYRFGALAKTPLQLVETCCKCSCELNFSLFPSSPYPYALWTIWQKRASSRAWQDAGIGIIVDLCVPQRFSELNLLGVPRGWRAYSTRGFAGREEDLRAEAAVAIEHGGTDAWLMVYGGGKRIREACQSIPNAIYVEQFQEKRHHVEG